MSNGQISLGYTKTRVVGKSSRMLPFQGVHVGPFSQCADTVRVSADRSTLARLNCVALPQHQEGSHPHSPRCQNLRAGTLAVGPCTGCSRNSLSSWPYRDHSRTRTPSFLRPHDPTKCTFGVGLADRIRFGSSPPSEPRVPPSRQEAARRLEGSQQEITQQMAIHRDINLTS